MAYMDSSGVWHGCGFEIVPFTYSLIFALIVIIAISYFLYKKYKFSKNKLIALIIGAILVLFLGIIFIYKQMSSVC
jgi:hypothetical protein